MRAYVALSLALVILLSACGAEGPVRVAAGVKQGVFYEIYVRSFADSDGDGTGDFKGITKKLNTLNDGSDATRRDLGVTGLCLTSVLKSDTYFGYDITDYYSLNPELGTEDDFIELLNRAHERDMYVIIELPIAFTSNKHPWFLESEQPGSDYRSRYCWTDSGNTQNVDLRAENDGRRVWTGHPSGYYAAPLGNDLPLLNYSDKALREEMKAVAAYWLNKGVDGFKMPYVNEVMRADALPAYLASSSLKLSAEWWQEFGDYCRSVKSDCLLAGDVPELLSGRVSYAKPLGSLMHYGLGEKITHYVTKGKSASNALIASIYEDLDMYSIYAENFLDLPFMYGTGRQRAGAELNTAQLKLAAAIYLTLEGLPFILYGDELGVNGGDMAPIFGTESYPWGAKDSAICKWYSAVPSKGVASYATQMKSEESLYGYYRRLIQLRTSSAALASGKLEPVDPGNENCLAYYMNGYTERVYVAHNLSAEEQTLYTDGKGTLLFSTGAEPARTAETLLLPPYSTVVIDKTVP